MLRAEWFSETKLLQINSKKKPPSFKTQFTDEEERQFNALNLMAVGFN